MLGHVALPPQMGFSQKVTSVPKHFDIIDV